MNHRISLIALATCLATPAIAQETPVIQASAGITNLRFEYSDMRPEDGIAASLTIKSPGSAGASVTGGVEWTAPGTGTNEGSSITTRGHLLDDKSYEAVLVNNEASFVKQPGSVVASVAVQASTFDKSTYVTTMQEWGEQTVGGGFFAANFNDGYGIALTLGAGTELRISGSLFSNIHLNTHSMTGLSQGQDVLVSASSDVFVSMGPSWETYWTEDLRDVLGPGRYPNERIFQSLEKVVLSASSGTDAPGGASDSRTFEFVARNIRDTAVTVYFSADLRAVGEWRSANANLPVPEPSTWALMLSGLALAGLSARRRQAN